MFRRILDATAIGSVLWFHTGCSRAPSIDVAGSFLPSWMLCLMAAVAVAILLRWQLVRRRLEGHVMPVVLFYPSLIVTIACLLWLAFFR